MKKFICGFIVGTIGGVIVTALLNFNNCSKCSEFFKEDEEDFDDSKEDEDILKEFEEPYVYDYLGNTYKSIKDMCDFYNVNYRTYSSRLKRGWTLEEALTGKKEGKE